MVQGRGGSSSLRIAPANALRGGLRPPGDKSISHRYLMLGGVANGTTEITNLAPGADAAATIACIRALGVEVSPAGDFAVRISGTGWNGLRTTPVVLDAQNSGTTLRLMAGLLAGRPIVATLTGDESLRRRPMARIVEPLAAMGARISATNGSAPVNIEGGGLQGIEWQPSVASAQVKSAIMLAGLSAAGESVVIEPHATRDHSELAFPAFGLECSTSEKTVRVPGGQEARAPVTGQLGVPGDPSSAAVWAAAAAGLADSEITLDGVCLNPRRLGFTNVLRELGADIRTEVDHLSGGECVGSISVRHAGDGSCVITADQVPDLIDELPVLAARAALGGSLEVSGAAELRVKESDRITALVGGLRSLGVDADERPDGFVVRGGQPLGGTANAAGDHRLVMAFAIVGLGSRNGVTITGAQAVSVSYPGFAADLERLRQ